MSHMNFSYTTGGKRPLNLLLFFALLLGSGCVTSYPGDIRLLSVAPSGSNNILGFRHRSPDRATLRLEFQSTADLVAYTRNSYGINVCANYCDVALQVRDTYTNSLANFAWSTLYADNGQAIEPARFAKAPQKDVDRTHYHASSYLDKSGRIDDTGRLRPTKNDATSGSRPNAVPCSCACFHDSSRICRCKRETQNEATSPAA